MNLNEQEDFRAENAARESLEVSHVHLRPSAVPPLVPISGESDSASARMLASSRTYAALGQPEIVQGRTRSRARQKVAERHVDWRLADSQHLSSSLQSAESLSSSPHSQEMDEDDDDDDDDMQMSKRVVPIEELRRRDARIAELERRLTASQQQSANLRQQEGLPPPTQGAGATNSDPRVPGGSAAGGVRGRLAQNQNQSQDIEVSAPISHSLPRHALVPPRSLTPRSSLSFSVASSPSQGAFSRVTAAAVARDNIRTQKNS